MKSKHIQTSPHYLQYTWGEIFVEYSRSLPSDHDVNIPKNIVGVALAPQEQVTWRVDGGSSQTTPLYCGSVFLYSEREFVWSRRMPFSGKFTNSNRFPIDLQLNIDGKLS
jgi:AraC family transcriptional regulator